MPVRWSISSIASDDLGIKVSQRLQRLGFQRGRDTNAAQQSAPVAGPWSKFVGSIAQGTKPEDRHIAEEARQIDRPPPLRQSLPGGIEKLPCGIEDFLVGIPGTGDTQRQDVADTI